MMIRRSYLSALFFPLFFLDSSLTSPAQVEQDSASTVVQDSTAAAHSSDRSNMCGPAGCIVSHEVENTPRENNRQGAQRPAAPTAERPVVARQGTAEKGPATAFEQFVRDTTGAAVPVFGQNLFLNTPADFASAISIAPPSDYVLGPGDQVKLRTWGNVQMDVTTTVDRNGQIFVPQVGTLSIAGIREDQLEGTLRTAISKQFRSFELSATLGQLRTIQVFVLGYARRPGVYTISSLSTLVNALFSAGGPSDSGSLRDIQVKRDNKVITHFDAYDLLMSGNKSKDVHLLPGDVIVIPVVGPQAAVVGDVMQPAIYELKGDTSAEDVLQLAGGLTAVAGIQRASLDRIVDHSRRTVQDFPLNGAQRLIQIRSGDVLRVFPVAAKIEQAVTLRGFVGDPGRYPWRTGMRIADLIPTRQSLLTRNYYNAENALNNVRADHPFAPEGQPSQLGTTRALVAAQRDAAASAPELLQQGSQPDLANHETEINWTYATIERLGAPDLTTHLVSFSLGDAIDHPDSPENKLLEPGDIVAVYSVHDINLPTELRARFVRVDGEVTKPGIYRLEDDGTLRDLVQRAGGLAPHAYPYAAQLNRESVRVAQELKLQNLLQRETQQVLSPINAVISPDTRNSTNDLELRRAYLQALRQMHASGRVVLQLSPTAKSAADLPAFNLQDGDHIFVPAVPDTVEVLGNVFNQGALRFVQGKRVGDYLNAAGGHTREADKGRDFVLRADGTVLNREKVGRFDKLLLYPGDAIVVPGRFKPGFNLYEALSVAQLGSNLAIAAAAVSALK